MAAVHAGSGSPSWPEGERDGRSGRAAVAQWQLLRFESGFTVCMQNNTHFPTGLFFSGSKRVEM